MLKTVGGERCCFCGSFVPIFTIIKNSAFAVKNSNLQNMRFWTRHGKGKTELKNCPYITSTKQGQSFTILLNAQFCLYTTKRAIQSINFNEFWCNMDILLYIFAQNTQVFVIKSFIV